MASYSNSTTESEIANRQHEYALATGEDAEVTQAVDHVDTAEYTVVEPSPPPPSRADRGKGIMAPPSTPVAAPPGTSVRGPVRARRLSPLPPRSNGAGSSRGVIQTENNMFAQTLLGRRSRQDAASFHRILQARFADGEAMVSGDLSRSIDYAVDRLQEGDKDAMHRLCARKVRP